MEHSSPLTAMQPSGPVLFGHCFRSESTTSYPSFPAVKKFGPDSFNFKDLSMKKSRSDYFSAKPVRGSSPTASLAADLSQNFHIDQSPQLATPRRSLFSANLFGPENGRENMTTPPLLSSSPAGVDIMDMSPLPHKTPFSVDTDLDMDSPTADISMAKSQQARSADSLQDSPFGGSRLRERRRPPILRPSLMRAKALSATLQQSPAPRPPPFKFAAGGEGSQNSSSLSLSEMFTESPPHERPSVKFNLGSGSMGPPKPRPPLSGAVGQWRNNGSPVSNSRGKNSDPYSRPRKLSRRSISMFEHPEEVINQEGDSGLAASPSIQSIKDIETVPPLRLPHFIPDDQADNLPRIDNDTLVDIINGKYNDQYDNIFIIDCRFEYEYEGGHIDGALNYTDKESLAAKLFDEGPKPNSVLIFHCEYSAHRAPIMAKYIRHRDRAVNVDEYPKLTYPEMYILHGGYSAFFGQYRSMCKPQNYVEMTAKEHAYTCERGLGKLKQRSKLSRAQTFAFGQHASDMEESPTGRCRPSADWGSSLGGAAESPTEVARLPARRMFTY
ncbi:hypothetical protein VTO42DRAFT_257 [Malbranchea cinnamomea]